MQSWKSQIILHILSIFSVLFIFSELAPGQTSSFLPADEAYENPHPGTNPTSSEEVIVPLPPVGPVPRAGHQPHLKTQNKENTQNVKNTQNGVIENNLSAPPLCSPQPPGYPPGPFQRFIRHLIEDWRENNLWPNGLPEPDREQVRSTMETMIQNGWRRQNLLSDFHFEPETGQLNAAGQEKLRWILWEVPEKHRLIYVGRATTASETAARLASVQKVAAQLMGDRPIPPILESELSPIGWPASQVDAIQRKFQETTPPPRLSTPSDSNNAK